MWEKNKSAEMPVNVFYADIGMVLSAVHTSKFLQDKFSLIVILNRLFKNIM